jgi:aromatic ring-opening dioxygenase LigB subunit
LSAATVPASLGPGAAAAIGRALADATRAGPAGSGPAGLVVMADLSACRTERAPGAFRAEAADYDASVSDALRTGEPGRLLDLDPELAADLLVAGRVALQVLAGAFEDEPPVNGRVLYEDAPYGVGYLVALLTAP